MKQTKELTDKINKSIKDNTEYVLQSGARIRLIKLHKNTESVFAEIIGAKSNNQSWKNTLLIDDIMEIYEEK